MGTFSLWRLLAVTALVGAVLLYLRLHGITAESFWWDADSFLIGWELKGPQEKGASKSSELLGLSLRFVVELGGIMALTALAVFAFQSKPPFQEPPHDWQI